MQEIKPEDVERLIREGKLQFRKTKLEFSDFENFEASEKGFLNGIVLDGTDKFFISGGSKYYHARFPLPDLRDSHEKEAVCKE